MNQTMTDVRVRPERTAKQDGARQNIGPAMDSAVSNDANAIGSRPPSRPGRRFGHVMTVVMTLIATCAAWLGNRYLVAGSFELFTVTPADLTVELTGPGTLDAMRTSLVSSGVQGVIAAMHVDRNDLVRQGDVIAGIVVDDLKSELGASLASLEAARKAVDLATADRERAEAALANAQSNFERQRILLSKSAVSRESYDTAALTLRQAEVDLDRAQAAIEQARAQESAAAATSTVQRARLAEGTIRAPFDGVVVSRSHYVGDAITPGSEILRLVDPDSIIVSARFDESSIYRLRPGQAAVIRFNGDDKGSSVTAHVLRVGREVDRETREFSVDLRPDVLPPNWALWQRATITIEVDTKENTLAVPGGAIERRQGQPGVWIVEHGRSRWNAITLGEVGGQLVEVVQGLEPGDVILSEPRGAYAGMRVESGAGP